jgi:hypothetical protein
MQGNTTRDHGTAWSNLCCNVISECSAFMALLHLSRQPFHQDPDVRRTSEVFRSMSFRFARLAGMLDPQVVSAIVEPPLGNTSRQALSDAWHLWVWQETQRRAVIGHYILDGQITHVFDFVTTANHLANPFPMLSGDNAFLAPTAEAWADSFRPQRPSTGFAGMFADVFIAKQSIDSRGLSGITLAALLEGLFSVVVEDRESPHVTLSRLSMVDVLDALGTVYASLYDWRGNNRVALLMRWHTIAMILLECNHDLGEELRGSRRSRRAVLHANAIRQLAENLSFSSISSPHFSIPYSVQRAATVLIRWMGVSFYSEAGLREPQYPLEHEVDWHTMSQRGCDRNGDDALRHDLAFVIRGGEVTLDGAILGHHHLLPMVTLLQAFGKVWEAASGMAEELASQLVT